MNYRWIALPIDTDEPNKYDVRALDRLLHGDEVRVKDAGGNILNALIDRRRGFAFRDPESEDPIDASAVEVRA